MNKSNIKGFMLLETLIVSTVILSTLIFLYIQFVNVKSNYEISFRYNTIPGLYMAKEVSTFLTENEYSTLCTNLDNNLDTNKGFINITDGTMVNGNPTLYGNLRTAIDAKTILFVNDDLSLLKTNLSTGLITKEMISEDFKKFILKLNTASTVKYRLIIAYNNNTFASIMIGGE